MNSHQNQTQQSTPPALRPPMQLPPQASAHHQHHHNHQQQQQQQQHHHQHHQQQQQQHSLLSHQHHSHHQQKLQTQQPLISNSLAIRQEIQRFESVHPSIYAIYDLIDLLPLSDAQIAQQIRDHVVCIEDSFVNSQEWTISRSVPDLRLGIVGSLSSGKSALVHRYLTGSYMQEESPEGGRFKKEVFIDGQSYLLLIRDEGGPPEMQFAAWVDAVIFVFSLENEASFNAVYNYYTKMAHFRNSQEIPIILVGTQDAITDRNPRVIEDSRARKLANDLKRCSYYETCATYGLNVERVFQDACQKILQQRLPLPSTVNSRPTTPQGTRLGVASYHHASSSSANGFSSAALPGASGASSNLSLPHRHHVLSSSSHHIPMRISADFVHAEQQQHSLPPPPQPAAKSWLQQQQHHQLLALTNENNNSITTGGKYHSSMMLPPHHGSSSHGAALTAAQHAAATAENLAPLSLVPLRESKDNCNVGGAVGGGGGSSKDLPTPTSTPTTTRKSRRRSNLFIPSSSKKGDKESKNGELGSGRSIPIKQGYLYKRSSKSLNKEWKKKYVTLCDDGRLTYHPSLHDYMDDVHGKEIPLQYVTVKVPGQKPRGSKSIITNSALTTSLLATNGGGAGGAGGGGGGGGGGGLSGVASSCVSGSGVAGGVSKPSAQNGSLSEGIGCLSLVKEANSRKITEKVLLTAFDTLREPGRSTSSQHTSGDEGIAMSNSNSQTFVVPSSAVGEAQQRELLAVNAANKLDAQTPNVKKRHRRMKSSGVKSNEVDDSDGYEFYIVSLDSKQWHFEAANSEERDEWVAAIEQEIFKSLQGIESSKLKPATSSELAAMVAIRTRVPGNGNCVDCDALNPEWASLNLGVLMCIECSGIHRNLGSHISKVRSLGLDDWPPGHLSVMLAIGNTLANSVWEASTTQRSKPKPNSTREEKEAWVRSKYEGKEFLASCHANTNATPGQQLIEAVIRADMKSIVLILATASHDVTNANVSPRDVRTPLLLACAIGNLAIAQLLLWNGANIRHTDHEGRTCLAYARAAQSLATAKSLKAASAAAAAAAAAATSATSNNTLSSSSVSNTSSTSSNASSSYAAGHATQASSAMSLASSSSTAGNANATPATNALTTNGTSSTGASNSGGIPAPQYSVEETTALVELLTSLGCPESAPLTASGTLPRRRDTLAAPYEKAVSGVI